MTNLKCFVLCSWITYSFSLTGNPVKLEKLLRIPSKNNKIKKIIQSTSKHNSKSVNARKQLSRCLHKAPSTKCEQVSQTISYLSIISHYLCETLHPSSHIFNKIYWALQNFHFFQLFQKYSFVRMFNPNALDNS